MTSTPPPPGRCTSSSTTSGRSDPIAATAVSTSSASATTLTVGSASSSARTPRLNMAWSSTTSTLTTSVMGLLQGKGEAHLGALAGGGAYVGRATVSRHAVDDRVGQSVPVARDRARVEPDAAVADEHLDERLRDLGVHVDPVDAGVLGGVDDRLAGRRHDRPR